jgi:hypothetical protein
LKQGFVPIEARNFYINLQNGPGSLPGDIAFHFNPRFYEGDPYVCKNNRRHGGWGGEERDPNCPLRQGSIFDMLILIDDSDFKVHYNFSEINI